MIVHYKTSKDIVEYKDAIMNMEKVVVDIIENKRPGLVWFLEHPSLFTAGTSSNSDDILITGSFPVHKTGRGGKHTYHGPGQRVVYVMLDLKSVFSPHQTDLKKYINKLEQVVIDTLWHYNIEARRFDENIGVWVKNGGALQKIASIGVRVKKWVTYHGVAININPDLSHFDHIVPCGLPNHKATSMRALGVKTIMEEFDEVFRKSFEKNFNLVLQREKNTH